MNGDQPRQVRIDQWNAFGTSTVGGEPTTIPLSIEVVPPREHGVWTVHGTAATAYDVVDALPWAEWVAVLNIGQVCWMDDDLRSLPPREIARAQGVAARAYDMDWTWSPGAVPNDLLVLASRDLRRFFEDWSTYTVEIVDCAGELSTADAEHLGLTLNARRHPVLGTLREGGTYFREHDDRHVTVESRDQSVPARVFARLLALYAANALDIENGGTITEPPRSLCSRLLERSPFWTGQITGIAQHGVQIGLAPQGWRPNIPKPSAFPVLISLDRDTQTWNGAGG
jgi:hypothetical protein